MGEEKIYRLTDLVKRLGRDKSTFIRWEAAGKIPIAKRDTRGWRYYTPGDFATVARFAETESGLPSAVPSAPRQPKDPAVPGPRTVLSLADDAYAVARAGAMMDSMPPDHAADVESRGFALPTMPRDADGPDHDAGNATSRAGGFGAFVAAVASFGIAFAVTTAALDDSAMRSEFVSRPPENGFGSVAIDQAAFSTSNESAPPAEIRSELRDRAMFLQQRFDFASRSAVEVLGKGILSVTDATSDLAYSVAEQAVHSIALIGSGSMDLVEDSGHAVSESMDGRIIVRGAWILRVAAADLAGIPRGAADEVRELAAFARWQFGETQRAVEDYGAAASAVAEDGLGAMQRALARAVRDITDDAERIGAWGKDATGRTLSAALGMRPGFATESADASPDEVSISVGTGVFPEAATTSFVADERAQAASKILLSVHAARQNSPVAGDVEPARGFWIATQATSTAPIEFDYVIVTPRSARSD